MKTTNTLEILFNHFCMEERPGSNEDTPVNAAWEKLNVFIDPIVGQLGLDASERLYELEAEVSYEGQKEAYCAGFAAAMNLIRPNCMEI